MHNSKTHLVLERIILRTAWSVAMMVFCCLVHLKPHSCFLVEAS